MGAVLAAAPIAAQAQPRDLLFERTVMVAAGARCALFAPQIAGALSASALQARGAVLRSGAEPQAVAELERQARERAATLDCRSAELAQAVARVQDAFSGYARLTRMAYPGDTATWRADRNLSRAARWRLAQEARFPGGRMTFGLAGRDPDGALLAVAQFVQDASPYAARISLRDSARAGAPYLRGPLLASRLPPAAALKSYLAEARSPAGADLLPKDARGGWAFRFPPAAISALASLDPREAARIEFLFPDGSSATAYVEVGDFAAGRAFLQVASR